MVDLNTGFRDLHVSGSPFILANAWDMGSARMLAFMGAKALGTSSAAHAFTLGLPDMGNVLRDEALEHGRQMARATPLPVSADLENGFGANPEGVGETIALAGAAGLAGCCIEDTQLPLDIPYEYSEAVARVEAAASAAREFTAEAGRDFVLSARADGIMLGHYDLGEAIRRLKAFEAVGADVLYAPMPPDMDALAQICEALKNPVNALCAGSFTQYGVKEFANIGVARISLGSSLARVTHRAILDCGRAMFESGDMSALGNSVGAGVIDPMLDKYRKMV